MRFSREEVEIIVQHEENIERFECGRILKMDSLDNRSDSNSLFFDLKYTQNRIKLDMSMFCIYNMLKTDERFI